MRRFVLVVACCLLSMSPAWSQTMEDITRVDNAAPRSAPAQAQDRDRTEATGGDVILTPERSPTAPLQVLERPGEIKPFGWELFAGQAVTARALGINPGYIIEPGDKISVQVWGAMTLDQVATVDLQGNIFLPEIGPVRVAGIPQGQLNERVRAAAARVYTDQVQIYTNLLNTQPVGVYVTGAVPRPGRYAGERNDSMLYYLSQAGGVDLVRGSFRDVRVMRGDRMIARVDLYAFLLNGQLPGFQFHDNDTIVVGPQQPTVVAAGEVQNSYLFEIAGGTTTGADVIEMARPLPKVTHVAIRGVRDGRPYNAYVSLAEFAQSRVLNGDELVFQADLVEETIFVGVIGQVSGPSSFAVPRGTRLSQVLDMIAIDPRTADIRDIYLRRKSVGERQKRALEMALDQLQRAVLTTSATTSSEAQLRAQEAQLVQAFVDKARAVEPEGRVVLDGDAGDMLVEAEDVIVIPQFSSVVMVTGEVQLPQTMVFDPRRPLSDYIAGAGGFTERADESQVLVLRQSGEVVTGSSPEIRPGDQIMVLPSAGSKTLAIVKDMMQIIYQIAVSSGVVIRLL